MTKSMLLAAATGTLLLCGCGSDNSPSAAGSSTSGTPAPARTAAPAANEVTVDLSPAGADYKGLSIHGPGYPKLLSRPGAPSVAFQRPASDKNAPEFTVTIGKDKLPVADMKKWVEDWAKGFNPPGKLEYITDKPDELEYSVELKNEDGKDEMAYGWGAEIKVGADTYSCSAPNLSGPDLPILKGVCRSLAKK